MLALNTSGTSLLLPLLLPENKVSKSWVFAEVALVFGTSLCGCGFVVVVFVVVQLRNDGVQSEHFNVWMRTAALPLFQNLWGRIDTTLTTGTTCVAQYPRTDCVCVSTLSHVVVVVFCRYNLTIYRSYNSARFTGRKSLIFVSGVSGCDIDHVDDRSFVRLSNCVCVCVCVFGVVSMKVAPLGATNPRQTGLLVDPTNLIDTVIIAVVRLFFL